MSEERYQLLSCIQKIERLEKFCVPYEEYNAKAQIGALTRNLKEKLGDNGCDALLGSRENLKKSKRVFKEENLKEVRIQLIDVFLNRKFLHHSNIHPNKPAIPLRKRMQFQAKHAEVDTHHSFSMAQFIKTRMGKLVFGTCLFILWLGFVLRSPQYFKEEYSKATPYLSWILWIVTFLAYVWGIKRTWSLISESLHTLVQPEKRAGKTRSAIITKYISAAIVIGFNIIFGLLIFDYFAHSAAAAFSDRKANEVAAFNTQNSSLWKIAPESQTNSNIEPSFAADFGSFAGTFGDFFGGVLNPILTFGTLLALAITLLMQRTQLIDEKVRADKSAQTSNLQTFETTFFNLLNLHNATVADLNLNPGSIMLPREEARVTAQRKTGEVPIISHTHAGATGRSVFASVLYLMQDLSVRANRYDVMEKHIQEPSDIYIN